MTPFHHHLVLYMHGICEHFQFCILSFSWKLFISTIKLLRWNIVTTQQSHNSEDTQHFSHTTSKIPRLPPSIPGFPGQWEPCKSEVVQNYNRLQSKRMENKRSNWEVSSTLLSLRCGVVVEKTLRQFHATRDDARHRLRQLRLHQLPRVRLEVKPLHRILHATSSHWT